MEIELKKILIKDLIENYSNQKEEGVTAYNGRLNVRPKYQREFIYKDKQRDAVIETISKGFPLNTMYWVTNLDGSYELLDGQQRTMSICEYVKGNFSLNFQCFFNLPKDKQEKILNYELMIYFCTGDESEKLDWFKVVNIAGEKLTEQELRNAVYTGSWLSDAKRYFSKTQCPARDIGKNYLKGISVRQDYLQTVIKWISNDQVESYMSEHQHKPNANELWLYFKSVISWVETLFPFYRKEMKGVNFGILYNEFKGQEFDSTALEEKIKVLMSDEDVTKKSGIYSYVISERKKFLNLRAFTDKQKREAYEKQNGVCIKCGNHFELSEMEADHITPWSEGGRTISENCQMLCKYDNRIKSNK